MLYFEKVDFKFQEDDDNSYPGTSIHQLAYTPETEDSLSKLEIALTEQDEKSDHKHFQKLRQTAARLKNGSAERRANSTLDVRSENFNNKKMYTPLVLASISNNLQTISILKKHGAKSKKITTNQLNSALIGTSTLSYEHGPFLLALRYKCLDAMMRLVREYEIKTFTGSCSYATYTWDPDEEIYEKRYLKYSYPLFFEALLTQDKNIVEFFTDELNMNPNMGFLCVAGNIIYTALSFMITNKLAQDFILWYAARYKIVIDNEAHFKYIREGYKDPIALLEDFQKLGQVPWSLIQSLLLEADIESIDYMFNHISIPGNECLRWCAAQGLEYALIKCVQHLHGFEHFSFDFDKQKIHSSVQHIANCANNLFNYKQLTPKGYKEALKEALKLGIISNEPSPLTDFLRNEESLTKKEDFKKLLDNYLPKDSKHQLTLVAAEQRKSQSFTPGFDLRGSQSDKPPSYEQAISEKFDTLALKDDVHAKSNRKRP